MYLKPNITSNAFIFTYFVYNAVHHNLMAESHTSLYPVVCDEVFRVTLISVIYDEFSENLIGNVCYDRVKMQVVFVFAGVV